MAVTKVAPSTAAAVPALARSDAPPARGPVPSSPADDEAARRWIELPLSGVLGPGRWARIRYRGGLLEDAVRPVLRFTDRSGEVRTEPINGPLWGTGEWIGRIPEGTGAMAVSAGTTPGPSAFEVLSVESLPLWRVLRSGLGRDRRRTLLSLGIWLFADRPAGERLLRLLGTTTPLDDYGPWQARLARPLDLTGFDAPRADWSRTPRIGLVAPLARASAEDLQRTIASLRAQAYSRWTLAFVAEGATASVLQAARDEARADGRVLEPGTAREPGPADAWWAEIRLGDLLPDHALAAVTEFGAQAPWLQVVYGDEDEATANGRLRAPRLKPHWSPVFFEAEPYLGRLALVRAGALEAALRSPEDLARAPAETWRRVLARVGAADVGHLRRILYRGVADAGPAAPPGAGQRTSARAGEHPPAAVVIPVRDRAELLARCTEGLLGRTDYGSVEVLVIDNGSQEARTHALLDRLAADPRVSILRRPGPFNYAALCNEGAAATKAPLLLFLNSDIDVIGSDWLTRLADLATRPDIGAVGAKLLYPDGTLQHAGVTVGLNGFAGHLYARAPRDEPGRLNELLVPHEVSAVTGACLAVERQKFDAVGGYDAVNLPVDLNDVDLCLRLAERGWRTVWTPQAELYHLESASRGRPVRGSKVYSKERAYFRERWAAVIRDDPYYHPALSLVSARRPVLG